MVAKGVEGKHEGKRKGKKKKRVRGQKPKARVMPEFGELPTERKLRDGKVREYNIWKGDSGNEKLPRKTKEMLTRIARLKGDKEPIIEDGNKSLKGGSSNNENGIDGSKANTPEDGAEESQARKNKAPTPQDARKETDSKNPFDGMKAGETHKEYAARLRKESKRMMVTIGRKENHQREKKRAFYERRKERVERRKRRRRGDYSDDDVEEGGDDYEEIAHLPSYWQDIVRNNGRPISAKRRKRMQRAESENVEKVAFGVQVERPPQLTAVPTRRGRKTD